MTVELIERCPSASEYLRLRAAVGWHALDRDVVAVGLGRSLYAVSALSGNAIVGCGRVVGDGAIYFHLQDLIVSPGYQGQGLGRRLMGSMMTYVRKRATPGSFVSLMAAPGLEGFYARFGFEPYPEESPAMLIWVQ